MDKGIIIGVEHEAAIRTNLPFVMFRHATSVGFYILLKLSAQDAHFTPVAIVSSTYIALSS